MKKSNFEEKVYRIVAKISPGQVLTYGQVARKAGSASAARAVGNAMAKNSRWPRVPCHRVICADGRVGNWSGGGGRERKISLLQKEGVKIKAGRVVRT